MALKVVGAGYGRTGTKSLQIALETLGFGKCYHMEALFRNPADVKHWQNAYKEQETDWSTLFEDYTSAVDFPCSMYYKELADHFQKTYDLTNQEIVKAVYEGGSSKRFIGSFAQFVGQHIAHPFIYDL